MLTKKRRKFDLKEKARIVDVARESGALAAARLAKNTAGFESVNARQVRKWRRGIDGRIGAAARRGHPHSPSRSMRSVAVAVSSPR